jgi:hypothetical protein
MGLVHKVQQSARSTDENVTALLELLALLTHGSTTINDTGAQHRAIA